MRLFTSANNPLRSFTSIFPPRGPLAPLLAALLAGAPTPRAARGDAVLCRDDRADRLAHDGAAQVARRPEIENDDWQAVVYTQRDRSGVHHAQPLVDDLQVGDPVELRCGLVDHGISGVDAVDL